MTHVNERAAEVDDPVEDELEPYPNWEDDMEDDETEYGWFAVKWTADGATTLSEAAAKLDGLANYLRALEASGAQLDGPIDNGLGSYLPNIEPSLDALEQFGLTSPEEAFS